MESTKGGFFVIDILPLKQPAGKPHHLEARLRGRSTTPRASAFARHTAFIEDRVRRLRRRTTHVKAVCAATRMRENGDTSAKRSRIDQDMQNAEQNRQAILEKQVKSCADTVAHAKEVARAQAERTALETAARKAALEQRLILTSLRRQRLLTTPRSRLLQESQAAWEQGQVQMFTADAVVCIQSWWRKLKLEPSIKSFGRFKITLDRAMKMPFEELVGRIQSPSVIKAVAALLKRVQMMVPKTSMVLKNPARVFLSAYMLAAHPEELMPSMGESEKALSEQASAMLRDFESWMSAFSVEGNPTQAFWETYVDYYAAFQTWKRADTERIVESMIAHFMELEKLWLSVKDRPLADVEWAPRIAEQQQQIHAKLAKFGDDALQRLAAEREQLRSATAESLDAPAVDVLSTSPQSFPSAASSPERRSDSVSPARRSSASTSSSSTPEVTAKSAPAAAASVDTAAAVKETMSTMETADPQLSAMGIGSNLSNAQLAHELVMDPDFQLKPSQREPLEEQIRAMAKKAFFDSVREEFNQGKFDRHVPAFIAQIRESLLSMVSDKGKFADNIKDVLDVEHVKQQIERNTFDVMNCLQYITQKMSQLCAPVRDAAIRNVAQSAHLAEAFERVLTILDDMKLDLANYRLQALRPVLQTQAVEYERTKFDEALDAKIVSLDRTRAWLSAAVNSVASTVAARNPESIQSVENRVKYENVYNEALLNIVFANTAIAPDTLAETMMLDAERLYGFQNEGQAITIVAALIMLSKNALRELRDQRATVQKLKEVLFILLKDKATTLDNLSLQVIATLNSSRPDSAPLSAEQETVIKNMVEKTLSYKDPVFSLISRRVQAAIRYQLEKGTFKRESLASAGLDIVQTELEALSLRIALLAKHNKEVYARHYDTILSEMVQ